MHSNRLNNYLMNFVNLHSRWIYIDTNIHIHIINFPTYNILASCVIYSIEIFPLSLFPYYCLDACHRYSTQGPDHIHVSKFYKEAKNGKFISCITENVRTLYQTFREGAYSSNNGPCLGWRETLTSPYQASLRYPKSITQFL